MAVRYDSQLKAQIRKTVRSFNAKIRRLEAKGVSASLLPSKVSSKQIQEGFSNRRDLRTRLQQLDEFSSAGIVEESEGGLLGTNQLFQYRQGEANRAIQEISREYQRVQGVETRYPMMQGEYAANLRTKMNYLARDVRSLDVKQINIFNKNVFTPEQKAARDENFYANFNRMLFYDAYAAGLPPDLVARISQKISKLTPQQVLEVFAVDPAFKAVTDNYHRSKSSNQELDKQDTKEEFEALEASLDDIIANQ